MHTFGRFTLVALGALALGACGGKDSAEKPSASAEKPADTGAKPEKKEHAEKGAPSGEAKGEKPSASGEAKAEHEKGEKGEKAEHEKGEKGEKAEHEKGEKGEKAESSGPGYHWEVSKKTNMKFELPKEWTTSDSKEGMVAKSATPGVGIEFIPAKSWNEKSDEKMLLKEVGAVLKDAKIVGGFKPVEQHGLKGNVAGGSGKKDGKVIDWFVVVLADAKGHAMLALGFYDPKIDQKMKDEVKKILDSIQPA